jgi:N-acetylglucosaminyldiphosphoundecaprenol N-acetyl-beta-D-mannosaminyltransferase
MSELDSQSSALEIFPIFNLSVHLADNYRLWLLDRIDRGLGTHVVTLNAEMVMMAEANPHLTTIIQNAELVIPDGSGIIMYMGLRGLKHQRCPGIELAASLLEAIGSSPLTKTVCFYGGTPGTTESAAGFWREKFPNFDILTEHGYLTEEEAQRWRETLQLKQPQVIFVGLGVPRQEFWIAENRHLCPNSIWIGVGGSFDIWSGNKSRAPQWLRNNNLEWSYRLYQEPWRWKRMLSLPKFFWRSLLAGK